VGKPSAPAAQDPVATANAQTASNKETAISQAGLNAMDQFGPQGSIRYAQNGTWPDGTPRLTQTTSLDPAQQGIFDTGLKTQQNLANTAQTQSKRLDTLLSTPFSLDNDAVEGRINELASKRLDPQLAQRREAEIARLANQGIKGGTAYDRAMTLVNQGENDARTSLLLNGRNQAVQEALLSRNQPLNEIAALSSGSQIAMPQFAGTPQTGVGGTDVAGITANANNAAQSSYNQQMGQWNSTAGGLFGLGANALLAFSDERLKTDIKATGEEVGGVPVKTWRWKGSNENGVGVMAQELEKKHPELVDKTHPSGFRRVNYGGLMQLGSTAQRRAA
jgi:hypothetical protein